MVMIGASLTATRLTATESQPHSAPPAPVAPLSVIERSRVSVGAGESEPTVYRTVAPPAPARSALIWASVPVNVRVGELFPAIVDAGRARRRGEQAGDRRQLDGDDRRGQRIDVGDRDAGPVEGERHVLGRRVTRRRDVGGRRVVHRGDRERRGADVARAAAVARDERDDPLREARRVREVLVADRAQHRLVVRDGVGPVQDEHARARNERRDDRRAGGVRGQQLVDAVEQVGDRDGERGEVRAVDVDERRVEVGDADRAGRPR